ncbi:MAG: fibrobacter succinogenes major paralogous domain-containing protein [Bacteroidales bacterium]|nr:fibrobacter succinogenes major paralogous domain-containing protein [Bacteroidales bacterium]HRX30931.1 fibrobacter succinogenes major paralogous domain-containing protein [Tenuifilaceae bacterium]
MRSTASFRIYSILLFVFFLFTTSCSKDDSSDSFVDYTGQVGTVTDADGNVYNTIGIGGQIWMAENLKVTHYRNGDPIDNVPDYTIWYVSYSGAYCDYNGDEGISNTYGKLYNWYAVTDSRGIAPDGWHVATNDEWTTLVTYLGGKDAVGIKLKEEGTTHWASPNANASNSSGFSALPGGQRINMGYFFYLNESGYWWTSSSFSSFGYYWGLSYDSDTITSYAGIKQMGLSVRCIKDK